MYKLRAIGEFHSTTLFNKAFDYMISIGYESEEIIDSDYFYSYLDEPSIIATKFFWDNISNTILEKLEKRLEKMGSSKREIEIKKLEIKRYLRGAEETNRRIFSEVDKGYKQVFLEGHEKHRELHPYAVYINSKGISLIMLDNLKESQELREYVKAHPDGTRTEEEKLYRDKLMIARENIWVERINPSPLINDSLLIAGNAHTANCWGLIDKLREKQINLDCILDIDKSK